MNTSAHACPVCGKVHIKGESVWGSTMPLVGESVSSSTAQGGVTTRAPHPPEEVEQEARKDAVERIRRRVQQIPSDADYQLDLVETILDEEEASPPFHER